MNQIDYSEILKHAKALHAHKKLISQDGILSFSDVMVDDIGGKDMSLTVRAHISLAEKLIGVPLECTLETDLRNDKTYLVFKNLKTQTLIDKKLWHLPQRLMNINYKFYLLWIDSDERREFYPGLSFPVLITKFK